MSRSCSTRTGVCATAGRLTTAGVQFVVVALFGWGGITAVVGLLVALLIIQAIAFALFGIETKLRPLEQIAPDDPLSSAQARRPMPAATS